MSGICKATTAITSAAQRDQLFPNSILPARGLSRVNGRLTDSSLAAIYLSLERQGKLVTLAKYKQSLKSLTEGKREYTKTILESLGSVEKATMNQIQNEFCFYYVRYKYSLEDLFAYLVATSSGTTLTAAQKQLVTNKLNTARNINTRLNDLIQFTNYVAVQRAKEMRAQNSDINILNNSITSVYDTLATHDKVLRHENAETILRKQMVDYTQEKNLSANNLLALYGFMNLVAIGLLVYISRT